MQHAWRARQLINACGGLPAASLRCRLEKSRLSEFQNPNSPATMPADIIDDLEAYCGARHYSRPLFEGGPDDSAAGLDVLSEACATTEAAALLQRFLRQISDSPPRLDRRQREQILADVDALEGHLRALKARCGVGT